MTTRIAWLLVSFLGLQGCLITETLADGGLPDECTFSCQTAGITCGNVIACGQMISCGAPCSTGGGAGGGGGGATGGGAGGGAMGGGAGGGATGGGAGGGAMGGGAGGGATGGGAGGGAMGGGAGGGTTGGGGGAIGGGGGTTVDTDGGSSGCVGLTTPQVITSLSAGGVSDFNISDFVVDGANLYLARNPSVGGVSGWNTDGRVAHLTTSGGPEVPYTQTEVWPENLQVVGSELFYISNNALLKVPISGGAVQQVFTPVQPGGRIVIIDAFRIRSGELFWADFGASNAPAAIYRTNLSSGVTVTLASNLFNIKEFIVDDTGVFWLSESGMWTMTLWTITHGTFVPVQLHQTASSTGASNMRGIATDATSVYYADPGSLAVQRLDKTTHAINMLFYGFVPNSLTIDGLYAYWAQTDCAQYSGGSCIRYETNVNKGLAAGGGPITGTRVATVPGSYQASNFRFDGTCLYFAGANKGLYKVGK